ncbi:MAG: hypothetical protein Q6370_021305 [Candidatus Sigynarchaeota archaeon]
MKRIAATAVSLLLFSGVLYYISAAVVADIIDGPLRAGLGSGVIPGLTAAIYIILDQVAVLALAFFIVVAVVYRDGRVAGLALLALAAGYLAMVAVAIVCLAAVPGFVLSFQNALLAPVLLDIYVLRNPGLGIAIQGLLFVVMLQALIKASKVATGDGQ